MEKYMIELFLGGVIVTSIGAYAFFNCSNLKTIEFASDSKLETIGKYSFSSTLIENVKIPSSVTLIDEYAFFACSNLIAVDIPINSKLNIIRKFSFSLFLAPPNKVIAAYVLKFFNYTNNGGITSIRIPSSVTKIEEYAFYGWSKLTTIEIPSDSKLKTIEKHSFSYTMIETIELPSQLTYIDPLSFDNCPNLKKVIYSSDSQYQKIGKEPFNQEDGKIVFEIIKLKLLLKKYNSYQTIVYLIY